LARQVRAYDPWPGSFTLINEGGLHRRLKVFPPVEACDEVLKPREVRARDGQLLIGCGAGSLRICEVQPDGSRRMKTGDYLRGRQPDEVEG
jgi:methionyl-tRNA formyltransferase